ncbi:MAG: putative zinc-binding peptidase [Marinospirillum sp.]|uniref:zinc-binding metallopeptidase family protein n=1 Tax=Marinospirillum sp. TaxID=2183934 RepID=UPI001A07D34F|nr:putative zinc-binding peptidase [Marinospirillum sp.]MBE0506609.1 putative zinc-binding peptidase [Marinospirillum sp.]
MKLFSCSCCGQLVYFENTHCTACGSLLGFVPDQLEMRAFHPVGEHLWQISGSDATAPLYHQCSNFALQGVCNWMLPATDTEDFCLACRLNHTIPDLTQPDNHGFWHRLEAQKRRLIYSLLQFGLPLAPRSRDPTGLEFDFLADVEPTFSETGRVLTGHSEGLITMNIAEADPVRREKMRHLMVEPYRTLLGHFRHESGHYYWDRLINNTPWLNLFRDAFGDERRDYEAALKFYYDAGPTPNWQQFYVSAYASMHPWEDWAETWAHYLHLLDTLETAWHFGLSSQPPLPGAQQLAFVQRVNPYLVVDFDLLIDAWLPLTAALNNLNRSMGHEDVYPFVLAPAAINKLRLVHQVIVA